MHIVILNYLSPISQSVYFVLIFITLDFLSGMYASYRNHVTIVSHKLRKTIEKFVCYSLAIIVAHMFQTQFAPWINISTITGGFIAITEIYSIYENLTLITKMNIFKRIFEHIKDMYFKK
jgi:hypothetical protein